MTWQSKYDLSKIRDKKGLIVMQHPSDVLTDYINPDKLKGYSYVFWAGKKKAVLIKFI